jgi:hypothetical protein
MNSRGKRPLLLQQQPGCAGAKRQGSWKIDTEAVSSSAVERMKPVDKSKASEKATGDSEQAKASLHSEHGAIQVACMERPTAATEECLISDPSGRFERTSELLGRGAYKDVYKAYDLEEGVEVAWCQFKLHQVTQQDAVKLLDEIQILQSLSSGYIIQFKHSWISRKRQSEGTTQPDAPLFSVCFVTELMSSGTLKNFIKRTKGPIKPRVYQGWCRQVLMGLVYLHSRSPAIIHRDLKCDNIFINGNSGLVKIGDLGLAILKEKDNLSSVLGTPEFMAPELYDGRLPADPRKVRREGRHLLLRAVCL